MSAKLEKTKTPGIFKRGNRYAVIYRDAGGQQRQESARTYDEARRLRTKRAAAVTDGSYQPQTREHLAEFAAAWVGRYQGNGRRGFSESTRREYRRDLHRYVIPRLGRLRLEEINARHIAEFVAWLCDEDAQGRREAEERRSASAKARGVPASSLPLEVEPVYLADATVRRILAPVRACLRTAMSEGLIRHNPTSGAVLPARDERTRIEEGSDSLEEHDVRALTTDQLAALLLVAPKEHRLLFDLLAATGLRISEALALRSGDLRLDGERPVVSVRRAWVRGAFKPPKSKYGRRQVPIGHELVRALRRAAPTDPRALLFPAPDGEPLHPSNLLMRAFKPAAEEAGAPWAGFHTLRHTCASRLFAEGRNAVQVQRWLGHHSAAFTLTTYVHLLNDDLGAPLELPSAGVSRVSARPTPADANAASEIEAVAA